jgi:hypothetical protein
MARFKENDLPKSKLPQVLSIKTLIFKYADNHRWKFYVGLVFIAYRSYGFGFPKLMGMLIDSVKK